MNVIDINKPNETINNKKCYSCGKVFPAPMDLQRHKNRKTPCLIRDVTDEQKMNPKRCIFCNNIYASTSNLKKHLTKCKIKNGGMEILDEKTRYEQEIRLIKDQFEKDRKKIEDENKLIREENKNLTARIEKIESVLVGNNAVNITNNATIINNTHNIGDTTNNIHITVQIENYLKPKLNHLIDKNDLENSPFVTLFKKNIVNSPIALIPGIWFNPDVPENYSIYLVNKSNGNVLVRNNNEWESANFHDGIADKLRDKAYQIAEKLVEIRSLKLKDKFEWEIGNMKKNRNDQELSNYEKNLLFHLIVDKRELVEPYTKKQINNSDKVMVV